MNKRSSVVLATMALALGLQACGGLKTYKGTDDGEGGSGGFGGSPSVGGGDTTGAGAGATTTGSNTTTGGGCTTEEDCAFLSEACSIGVCVAGMCEKQPANEGSSCDDGQFCTENDYCSSGSCYGGSERYCPSDDVCGVGSCDEAKNSCTIVPGNDGASCDDGDPCTETAYCSGGTCTGSDVVDCSYLDKGCFLGVCDPNQGCTISQVPNGTACDDGDACTSGDVCTGGVCKGAGAAATYFTEDFKNNAKGWVLGTEWQIGSAKASAGGQIGADPATDHTPTADNGVAGVVIGGNASVSVHAAYYLTSPAFNTANAPTLVLSFYRWLNSDLSSYMSDTVEVWDGAKWVVVWQNGPNSTQDSPPEGLGWTLVEYDLTPYKNAAMKIRFGHSVVQGSAYIVGSWNIDDITVASGACN